MCYVCHSVLCALVCCHGVVAGGTVCLLFIAAWIDVKPCHSNQPSATPTQRTTRTTPTHDTETNTKTQHTTNNKRTTDERHTSRIESRTIVNAASLFIVASQPSSIMSSAFDDTTKAMFVDMINTHSVTITELTSTVSTAVDKIAGQL